MVSWAIYSVMVSFFLGASAAAAERVLRALGRPSRWGPAAGLVGSVAVSAIALLAPGLLLPKPTTVRGLISGTLEEPLLVAARALEVGGWIPGLRADLDAPFLAVWILGSFATISLGVLILLRMVRSALRHPIDHIGGVEVRRTRGLGPAVVGFFRGIIVFPEWTRTLPPLRLHLSVTHEREHTRALDPFLLFGAYLLVGLQPWNPSLWWQLFRLKRAVETDCDRRVLEQGADPRSYASLLLHLAAHKSRNPPFAVALPRGRSRVGRRIGLMADGLSGVRPGKAWAAGLLAAAFLGMGLYVPLPGPLSPLPTSELVQTAEARAAPVGGGAEVWERSAVGSVAGGQEPREVGPGSSRTREWRGEEALRVMETIRKRITLVPGTYPSMEFPLEDGGTLHVLRTDSPLAAMIKLARPTSPIDSSRSQLLAVLLRFVDGEPVFTITEA